MRRGSLLSLVLFVSFAMVAALPTGSAQGAVALADSTGQAPDEALIATPGGLAPWGDPPRQPSDTSGAPDETMAPGRGFHPSLDETPESNPSPAPSTTPPPTDEAGDFQAAATPSPSRDVSVASAPIRWVSNMPRGAALEGPTPYVMTATAGVVLLGLAIVSGHSSSVPQVTRVRPFQRGRRQALAAAPRMPETALGLLGEAHHYGAVVRCQASMGEAVVSMRRNPRVPCEEVEGYLVGLFEAVWGRDVEIRHAECMQRGQATTCDYHLRAVVRREVKTSVSYVPLRPEHLG